MHTMNSRGEQTTSLVVTKTRAVEYFTSLYLCDQRVDQLWILTPLSQCYLIRSRSLDAQVSHDFGSQKHGERNAKEKGPGPDDMIVKVLVHHWETIKVDQLVAILYFTHQRMLTSVNHTFIILILKHYSLTTFNDFHPISCLGVSYKVISKILANRITIVLPNFIVENQMAFIKGRIISNHVNLSQEFTQAYNNSNTSQRAFITIDFCKAFDTLR